MLVLVYAAVALHSPQPYQVIQRIDGVASVPVRLEQPAPSATQIEVTDAAGQVLGSTALAAGSAEATLDNIPQGGWYHLVVKQAGKELESVTFGVGDVFVIAGQSNAGGNGDGFIPDRSGMVSVKAWEADHWVLADKPDEMHPEMQRGSAWPILGELLATAWQIPIGIINVARGGSNTDQWLPETADLYPRLRETLKTYKVRAVLWHQGESDANLGFSTDKTVANMQTFIRQSRADAGWEVPWYIAFVSFVPNLAQENMDAIRAAQKRICEQGLALPGPDTDLYVPVSMRWDNLHFAAVGLRVHAILWFMTLTMGAPSMP